MALGLKWWVGENAVHYLLQEIEAQSILTPDILRIAKRDLSKLSEDQRRMVDPVFEAMWARFPSDPRAPEQTMWTTWMNIRSAFIAGKRNDWASEVLFLSHIRDEVAERRRRRRPRTPRDCGTSAVDDPCGPSTTHAHSGQAM
uniref:Death domain-containing protein n=1 Tax=Steinernema glaseri TaxID=37863 RepID=A0A1I7Z794_9BILA